MPVAAKRPCLTAGCRHYATKGAYCEEHQAQRRTYDEHRGNSTQRGYNSAWRKARDAFLRKHPLCVGCERQDRVVAAEVVDHVIPHKGDKELFWDRDNWQSLCKPCHDRKTRTEDMGAWSAPSRQIDYGVVIEGECVAVDEAAPPLGVGGVNP